MKILVTHISNTFNYGSAMMAINLMYYLNRALDGKVEFYTDTRGQINLARLRESIGLSNIHINSIRPSIERRYMFRLLKFFNNVNHNIGWIKQYAEGIIENYDAVIICGGDDLSEYYNKIDITFEIYKISQMSRRMPVFLVSQTIGPFTKWRKNLARKFLKNSIIYARDLWSYRYLKETLGLLNVFEAADLAFLDLPQQMTVESPPSILEQCGLERTEYITIVPSGLVQSYTSDWECYILTWLDIILNLLNDQRLKAKKIVLLPHVLRPLSVDDRVVIREIERRLTPKHKKRIVSIYDPLLPCQARLILGNGLFTITGRMHAAISTFQLGKPAVSISYSIKYQGVIEETLGIKNLVVRTSNQYHWEFGVICDEVGAKVDYILNNYSRITDEINTAVAKSKEKALSQIIHLAQTLQDGEKNV